MKLATCAAAAAAITLVLCRSAWCQASGDDLLYTQVQFIGTDQSQHQAPPQAIIDLFNQPMYQAVFANQSANFPQSLLFSHLSITGQLGAGVRGFEFDVHDDSKVGQYAYSAYLKLAGQPSLISPDLLKPGLKVFSTPDYDFGSSCYLFKDCLQEIANYSAVNPGHFPITIFIHKGYVQDAQSFLGQSLHTQALTQLQASGTPPMNFTAGKTANLIDVQNEILSVFDRSQLYTPDDLRAANNASADAGLRDIVFPGGSGSWPTIGDLRNMVIFMADPDYLTIAQAQFPNSVNTLLWQSDDQGFLDSNVVVLDAYVDVLLTNTTAGPPYGLLNNSAQLTDAAAWGTQNMVLQGFFVRAGADTSPTEGTFGYTYRRDTVATIGGPQFIATLYEAEPLALLNSNYSTSPSSVPGFNGAEAICNPVTTGELINMGNAEFAADGALPQDGATTIIQEPPPCLIPEGFSPGKYASPQDQPGALAPAPAPAAERPSAAAGT